MDEKKIDELSNEICMGAIDYTTQRDIKPHRNGVHGHIAERLIQKGYRKESDTAREILEMIDHIPTNEVNELNHLRLLKNAIANLYGVELKEDKERVMKYEEVIEIIERVRNGEKAEDIIDFEQETIDGEVTPKQALEVVNEALICRTCKKPLVSGDELFVCKECAEKSREQFYQTNIGKALKDKGENDWCWFLGLMVVADIFGLKGDNDKND